MITEFAIPYAAADPIHVLPAIIAGSSVGAALSYAFDLSITAPHGGLLVILLANKPVAFLIILYRGVGHYRIALCLEPKVTESEEKTLSL
jgi:PTS system fructose-specific IIC component